MRVRRLWRKRCVSEAFQLDPSRSHCFLDQIQRSLRFECLLHDDTVVDRTEMLFLSPSFTDPDKNLRILFDMAIVFNGLV